MPQYREGQTATNPTTGEKVVFKGGAWTPAGNAHPLPGGINSEWVARRERGEPVLHPNDDPYRLIQDPKRRDISRGQGFSQGSQYLAKHQDAVNSAREALTQMDEFDELNDRIKPDGGVVNRAGNWLRDKFGDSDLARMTEISTNLARKQRQPGEGAVSDFEGRLFAKMVGGYDKPYEANRRYSQAAHAIAKRQIDFHQFQEAYLRSNGTLVGADSMWSAYRDHNPVIDKGGNPRQVPTWQQFFAQEADRLAGKRPPQAPPSARRPSNGGWSAQRVK